MPEAEVCNLRLDDLYKMTAHIYADRNSVRSKEATFVHFVEVCGMLTIHDRRKKREHFDMWLIALSQVLPYLAAYRTLKPDLDFGFARRPSRPLSATRRTSE